MKKLFIVALVLIAVILTAQEEIDSLNIEQPDSLEIMQPIRTVVNIEFAAKGSIICTITPEIVGKMSEGEIINLAKLIHIVGNLNVTFLEDNVVSLYGLGVNMKSDVVITELCHIYLPKWLFDDESPDLPKQP